eukprot:3359942-Prymnesium_polylepis.1
MKVLRLDPSVTGHTRTRSPQRRAEPMGMPRCIESRHTRGHESGEDSTQPSASTIRSSAVRTPCLFHPNTHQ